LFLTILSKNCFYVAKRYLLHCLNAIKNKIIISGIDKQLVGETAARIRRIRPPEPYKGKGIRYLGEVVKRKVGKITGEAAGEEK